MIITITELDSIDRNKNYKLYSESKKFKNAWGNYIDVSNSRLFEHMKLLSSWCNNDLEEECLFEID